MEPHDEATHANGQFFFDGTLTPPAGVGNVVYSGEASFYFTGGVTWNTGSLCGIAGCGSSWDTRKNVLFIVADCTGQPGSGCVSISSSRTHRPVGVFATDVQGQRRLGEHGPRHLRHVHHHGRHGHHGPDPRFPPGTPAPTTSVAYTGTPPTGWAG